MRRFRGRLLHAHRGGDWRGDHGAFFEAHPRRRLSSATPAACAQRRSAPRPRQAPRRPIPRLPSRRTSRSSSRPTPSRSGRSPSRGRPLSTDWVTSREDTASARRRRRAHADHRRQDVRVASRAGQLRAREPQLLPSDGRPVLPRPLSGAGSPDRLVPRRGGRRRLVLPQRIPPAPGTASPGSGSVPRTTRRSRRAASCCCSRASRC